MSETLWECFTDVPSRVFLELPLEFLLEFLRGNCSLLPAPAPLLLEGHQMAAGQREISQLEK